MIQESNSVTEEIAHQDLFWYISCWNGNPARLVSEGCEIFDLLDAMCSLFLLYKNQCVSPRCVSFFLGRYNRFNRR